MNCKTDLPTEGRESEISSGNDVPESADTSLYSDGYSQLVTVSEGVDKSSHDKSASEDKVSEKSDYSSHSPSGVHVGDHHVGLNKRVCVLREG